MSLEGRVAVVTGASRGIGLAVAKELARMGAEVACIATTETSAGGAAAAVGDSARAFACDVSDKTQVETCYAAITESMGAPLILVNNAGVTRDNLLVRITDDDWDRVIDVNLKGAFLWTKECARAMIKSRWGRIVSIGSVVGLSGAAGQANYAASKAGLVGLTKALAKELGPRNVTCNLVAPGFVETDMTAELAAAIKDKVIGETPLGRLGTPEDIAAVVGFLVSDGASYMTGQVIAVDGGLIL